MDEGRLRDAASGMLADLVKKSLEAVGPTARPPIANYRMLITAYVLLRIGATSLERLTPSDVRALYTAAAPQGLEAHQIAGLVLQFEGWRLRLDFEPDVPYRSRPATTISAQRLARPASVCTAHPSAGGSKEVTMEPHLVDRV